LHEPRNIVHEFGVQPIERRPNVVNADCSNTWRDELARNTRASGWVELRNWIEGLIGARAVDYSSLGSGSPTAGAMARRMPR
jgi:hypothetical protein